MSLRPSLICLNYQSGEVIMLKIGHMSVLPLSKLTLRHGDHRAMGTAKHQSQKTVNLN
jgi:hypothetical protein